MRYESEGLIFGGAYTRRDLFSEFYGNTPRLSSPPPPSPPNLTFSIAFVSNLSWVLQSSQEKLNTILV